MARDVYAGYSYERGAGDPSGTGGASFADLKRLATQMGMEIQYTQPTVAEAAGHTAVAPAAALESVNVQLPEAS